MTKARVPIARWVIPRPALFASYVEMASDGAKDREGIALWAGKREATERGDTARVTHIVLLRGPGIRRARGFISIDSALLNEVADELATIDDETYLVGQIHGHPPRARVDLSPTDILYGIRTPDYLSVVAPNYGMHEIPDLSLCGVHVFEAVSGWRRFAEQERIARVLEAIDNDREVSVVTVGREQIETGERE